MEQDLTLIVKNLWESVDKIVNNYKQEVELLKSYKEYYNDNYNENEVVNFNTYEFISFLLEQNELLKSENIKLKDDVNLSYNKIKEFDRLYEDNERLKTELVRFGNEKINLVNQINDFKKSEKDIEFTKLEIARKNKELNSKVSELNNLKEEIASKDMVIYKLNNNKDVNSKDNIVYIEQIKLLEEDKGILVKKLNKRDEEIKEQKYMIDEFNQRLLNFNKEKYNMNNQIETCKGTIDVLNIKLERLEVEKSKCESRINELTVYQKLCEKNGEEIDELNKRLSNLEVERDSNLLQIDRLEKEIERYELSESEVNLKDNVDYQKLSEEREYYKDKLKKAEIILGEINRQMNEKERLIEELKGQQSIFQSDANDKEIAAKNKEIKELESKLEEITNGLKDQNGRLRDLDEILHENENLKSEFLAVKNNNKNLETIALSRLNEIKQLQIKIDEYSSKYKSIQKDKMIKEVDNLIKRLEKFAV